jgi:hypothetical protein
MPASINQTHNNEGKKKRRDRSGGNGGRVRLDGKNRKQREGVETKRNISRQENEKNFLIHGYVNAVNYFQ